MSQLKCSECGLIFDENLNVCPNCGCPSNECEKVVEDNTGNISNPTPKSDWADNIYECGVLYWDTISRRYFDFSGRASRFEYWSFLFITLWLYATSFGFLGLFIIIPLLAVSVRRMHDINRSGWWILVPWISVFFLFKKSDKGINDYGHPNNINI